MGNRFNPWHLRPFRLLPNKPHIVCFRAESEIQRYFSERDDGSARFPIEPIFFDTQAGNPLIRIKNRLLERYAHREPRILPFADRLQHFDLIQTWELFTDWTEEAVNAGSRFRIPVSVMVWDNIPFNMETSSAIRRRKQRVIASATMFFVYTERSRRTLLLEGVAEDRIIRINPGVDVELFVPGQADRAAWGIEEDTLVLLFVGWFLPRKGLDVLLFALHELVHHTRLEKRDIRLLIVGSGPGRERVEQLIERLGLRQHCLFIGSRPYSEMPSLYRLADIFVFPSVPTPQWQEQFGMALLEAMACGIPTVAAASGAIPEIAGDAALLCQTADFVALHDALEKMISDANFRTSLGQAARLRVETYFDVRKTAAELAAAYERLLEKSF